MNAPARDPQWDHWRNALKGQRGPISDGNPESGFYRNRNIPYAYWKDAAGTLHCHINGKACLDMDRANTAWPFASKEPVTRAAYDAVLSTGTWPDQHEAVTTLSNSSPVDPDSLEGVKAQIDILANEADMIMKKGAAKTQIEADRAADVAVRLGELWTKADNLRKVEKRPHYDKAVAVDNKWAPLLKAAEIYSFIKGKVIKPFLDAENIRLEQERQALIAKQQEEQKKRDEERQAIIDHHNAEVEAARIENKPLPEPPQNFDLGPELEEAPYIPPVQHASAGTRGRGVSGRKKMVARIDDYAAALASFAQHEEVKTLVQNLATKQARIGVETPGCKIVNEGSAV